MQFHFLRPLWLTALLPAALILWRIARMQDPARGWRDIIAGHLLPHLLTGGPRRAHRGPLILLAGLWILSVVALAGPAWRHEPPPFAEDTAALTIVLKVTPSMRTEDVQPDRLGRAIQKIHDLLELRTGAKSALIAYAGSAHVVMPLTRDRDIINTFAGVLDPRIMPTEGDAAVEALTLAAGALSKSGQAGSILWITDGLAPEQQAALARFRKDWSVPLRTLAPLPPGAEADALKQSVRGVSLITPNDSDVRALAQQAKFAAVVASGQGERWKDAGWWLTPLIALPTLMWFRPGWGVREIA